jgi:hypothetical protein
MVKETCCSYEARIVGLRDNLQRHHRLGKRLGLELREKTLRFRFTNHLLGRSLTSIHGSESKIISGLY